MGGIMRLTRASTSFVAADMAGVDDEDSFGMASKMTMYEVSVRNSILMVISTSPKGSPAVRGGQLTKLGRSVRKSWKACEQNNNSFWHKLGVREIQLVPVPEADKVQSSHDVTTCIRAIRSNPHPNDARSLAFQHPTPSLCSEQKESSA
jgi:hypothetical protein